MSRALLSFAANVLAMQEDGARAALPKTPRVFVVWSHTSDTARASTDREAAARADANWREQVFDFVAALRERGIDADIDLFHMSDLSIDWTRYGPRAVAEADVVLAIVNEAWRDAWDETGDGSRGRGAVVEIDVLRSLFNRGRDAFQGSLVLVILPGAVTTPPLGLDRVQRVRVPRLDDDGMADLLRMLTGQPAYRRPPLGKVPALPQRTHRAAAAPASASPLPHDPPEGSVISGSGDSVLDLEVPPGASHVMAVIEGNGAERHFAVRDLGGRGALVNTTSRYRGTTFVPVPAGASKLRLEVKAVGPWQVVLADVAGAASLSHGDTIKGSGDAVLIYDGPGGVAHVAGNSDGRFFAVQAVPRALSRGKSIVNTTDEYTGSVLCPPGPLLLVIRAQGDWSIGVT